MINVEHATNRNNADIFAPLKCEVAPNAMLIAICLGISWSDFQTPPMLVKARLYAFRPSMNVESQPPARSELGCWMEDSCLRNSRKKSLPLPMVFAERN